MYSDYIYTEQKNPYEQTYRGSYRLAIYQSLWCLAIFFLSNYHIVPLLIMCNGLNYHLFPNSISRWIDIVTNGLVTLYFNLNQGSEISWMLSVYLVIFYSFGMIVNSTQKMDVQINYHLLTVQTIGFLTLAVVLCKN